MNGLSEERKEIINRFNQTLANKLGLKEIIIEN